MATQFIVAVMLDGTLNVSAAGPFRSRERAEEVAARINRAGEWTEPDPTRATILAQVVPLQTAEELVEEAREYDGD